MNLLIISDQPADACAAARVLASMGHDWQVAAPEALTDPFWLPRQMSSKTPAAILLDLHRPTPAVLAMLEALQQGEHTRHVPKLLVTGVRRSDLVAWADRFEKTRDRSAGSVVANDEPYAPEIASLS